MMLGTFTWGTIRKADEITQSSLMFGGYTKEEQVLSFEISIFRINLTRYAKVRSVPGKPPWWLTS